MKRVILVLLLATGCASYSITQRDESPNERIITTQVNAKAWFSSAQTLTKVSATQTDKTQKVGTDSITQQGATNTANILRALLQFMNSIGQ